MILYDYDNMKCQEEKRRQAAALQSEEAALKGRRYNGEGRWA